LEDEEGGEENAEDVENHGCSCGLELYSAKNDSKASLPSEGKKVKKYTGAIVCISKKHDEKTIKK